MTEFTIVQPIPAQEPLTKFYGYRDSHWPDMDPQLDTYLLVKETPAGFWIRPEFWYPDKPMWVSKTARRRKAYPTQAEALHSYLARKERHVSILTGQLGRAKRNLNWALKQQPDQKSQVS